VVEYFHQVDDGYSHLAIQVLAKLKTQYDADLIIHLVPALKDDNFPEPDLLQELSRTDAANVAPYFGLDFPKTETLPRQEFCTMATAILCRMDVDEFSRVGVTVSECLWRGDEDALKQLTEDQGIASADEVKSRLKAGSERRAELGHYGGAMFWYEGEWYWGVDRLYHLEERLKSLGLLRDSGCPLIAPRPAIPSEFKSGAKLMTLEYFASLRSPYTAVSWEPTMNLVRDSGINLVLRPVLPMVMRGVPATVQKGIYIWFDAAREARAMGVDQRKFYDPIGKPVMRGYSLYIWALERGKGNAFFGAFLKAAFDRGINTSKLSGLQRVIEMADLDWKEAKRHIDDDSWQESLEDNRRSMYGFGSWGVPSYRLLDADGKEILGVWGQDRLWLIAKKIDENV
jgi:2-hydroxychromene-2-carboxylate isomerase